LNAAETIDALIDSRALVFGSLPPLGRDLDLLVRPPEESAIVEGLAREGFVGKGAKWARFTSCSADVVELVPAAAWLLPPAELSDLFADAVPLEGRGNLVCPAPHHLLLVTARKLGPGRIRLDPKQRARVDEALAEDPGAWREALRRAPLWRAEAALEALRFAYLSGDEGKDAPTTRVRRSARALSPARVRRKLAATIKGQGALITFSGLDGAGKSFQAEHLRTALDALGYDAVVVWTSITIRAEWLIRLKALANRFLGLARRRVAHDRPPSPEGSGSVASDPAKALRHRSGAVAFAWTALVALANARRQRRDTRRHLRRGRIVICDRWTLDSAVQLCYLYGERDYGFHQRLIRAISPRPRKSYFLDVRPEVASARQPEYEVEENVFRTKLYRELAPRMSAIVLDGELPPEELCATIATGVWWAID
jgi:thymidylate kinase